MDFGPPELLILLVVVIVLFGGSQLPKLAKNLGKAQREFKAALDDAKKEAEPDTDKKVVEPASAAPTDNPVPPADPVVADDDHPAHTD